MSVQIQFLESELALIWVPLAKVPLIYQGLVKLTLRSWESQEARSDTHLEANSRQNTNEAIEDDNSNREEELCNISFTPYECSIICSFELIPRVFGSLLDEIEGVVVTPSTYVAIKIDGDGLDDSTGRILGLSSPLSAAKVPIFFLSTYFSDYLLVPTWAKEKAEQLLMEKGYAFSMLEKSYVSLPVPGEEQKDHPKPPVVENIEEIKGYNVRPTVSRSTRLILTGARQNCDTDALELALVRTLLAPPEYFSVTMHYSEISFLVDEHTVGDWPATALLGSLNECLVPSFINLEGVPLDVVGVVATISERLAQVDTPMSYVSTARSCVVLISVDHEDKAIKELDAVF